MPQLDWDDETAYATMQHLECRSTGNIPTDSIGVPDSFSEIHFNKITQDGRRYLDIAVNIGGRPMHYTLDRDQIEQLRAFLAGPEGQHR